MAYTIHLDQETTQQMIYAMRIKAERMYDSANTLYRVMSLADWRCAAREDFIDELYSTTRQIRHLCDQLDALAFEATRKTEQWVIKAANFNHRSFPY